MTEPLWKACEEAAAGLGQLANAYGLLHESRIPGGRGARVMRVALGPRSPVSDHLLTVIWKVEQLAYFAEEAVCAWLNRPFIAYRPWWQGEPNPLTVLGLVAAAQGLPEALPYAGHDVLTLASQTTTTVADVRGVLGVSGGAELAGDCPVCYSPTLIKIYSPERTLCAAPGCTYEFFKIRKETVA